MVIVASQPKAFLLIPTHLTPVTSPGVSDVINSVRHLDVRDEAFRMAEPSSTTGKTFPAKTNRSETPLRLYTNEGAWSGPQLVDHISRG